MARDTRERLLDIGLDQFASHGLAATTITDLERQAGLRAGSGSFYRHFSSKEDLLIAVVERELGRVQQVFKDSVIGDAGIGDSPARLASECQRVLLAVAQVHKLSRILLRDQAALGPLIERVRKTISVGIDINTDLLADLMDTGALPRRDPRTLSVALTTALLGYQGTTSTIGAPPGGVPAGDFIATLVGLVVT